MNEKNRRKITKRRKAQRKKIDCNHRWSDIKEFNASDLDDFMSFLYQQCNKCGIVRKI